MKEQLLTLVNNKILDYFFTNPTTKIHLRELARQTNISPSGTSKMLKPLIEAKLIVKESISAATFFQANLNEDFYRIKKIHNISQISDIGLLNYLTEKTMPDAVIIFGSASRGEDIEASDIDLYIQSKETKLNLSKFEKILNRKINIFFEPNFSKLSSELKNNILNGVKLYGYLEVYK